MPCHAMSGSHTHKLSLCQSLDFELMLAYSQMLLVCWPFLAVMQRPVREHHICAFCRQCKAVLCHDSLHVTHGTAHPHLHVVMWLASHTVLPTPSKLMQETDFVARSSTSPRAMSLWSSCDELDASQNTLASPSSAMDDASYTDFMWGLAYTESREDYCRRIVTSLLIAAQKGWHMFMVVPFVTQAVCLCVATDSRAMRSLVCKAQECVRPFGRNLADLTLGA